MRILISGARGLLGSALGTRLRAQGATLSALTRRPCGEHDIGWDPERGSIEASDLDGFDAVVHLAGENIAGGRWTARRKQRIEHSRVAGTALLARTLAAQPTPPAILVCASAIGWYGDRDDVLLDETSAPGDGFLAQVCRAWEQAADAARARGIRVVHLRFGAILAREGGLLARLLPPFRLGLGGVVGSGRQWLSWIALADAVGAICHTLATPGLAGAINAVAPGAVQNRSFTRTLGRLLRRPTIIPLPAPLARLALGELADALLLASTRVRPARLQASGYAFAWPELAPALRHLLGHA